MVKTGVLVKIQHGIYHYPKRSRFGILPANTDALLTSFLKDDEYLLTSPNDFNSLGLGTTQLYNYHIVFNYTRHGLFELDGQMFDFQRKPRFPNKVSPEFLLVVLLNDLDQLAENREAIFMRVPSKVRKMNANQLGVAAKKFGKVATKKLISEILANEN